MKYLVSIREVWYRCARCPTGPEAEFMNVHVQRFLDIIMRVLRLEGFLNHRERGTVRFSVRFSFYLLYTNCKRLREF